MKFTVGKLIWGISITIFFVFAYNQSTFHRVFDIFIGEGSNEIHVQKFISQPKQEVEESADFEVPPEDDLIEFETGELSELASELCLHMELLKYKVQRLEDDYDELKKDMRKAHEEKDDSMDNILAIITTLMPIAIPYFTRKSHNKEITVFQRGAKK